jgi:hypothetical protein
MAQGAVNGWPDVVTVLGEGDETDPPRSFK